MDALIPNSDVSGHTLTVSDTTSSCLGGSVPESNLTPQELSPTGWTWRHPCVGASLSSNYCCRWQESAAHLDDVSADEQRQVFGERVGQVDQRRPAGGCARQRQHLRPVVLHVVAHVVQPLHHVQRGDVRLRLGGGAPVHVCRTAHAVTDDISQQLTSEVGSDTGLVLPSTPHLYIHWFILYKEYQITYLVFLDSYTILC